MDHWNPEYKYGHTLNRCVSNIRIFECIWIFINKCIHSSKYSFDYRPQTYLDINLLFKNSCIVNIQSYWKIPILIGKYIHSVNICYILWLQIYLYIYLSKIHNICHTLSSTGMTVQCPPDFQARRSNSGSRSLPLSCSCTNNWFILLTPDP